MSYSGRDVDDGGDDGSQRGSTPLAPLDAVVAVTAVAVDPSVDGSVIGSVDDGVDVAGSGHDDTSVSGDLKSSSLTADVSAADTDAVYAFLTASTLGLCDRGRVVMAACVRLATSCLRTVARRSRGATTTRRHGALNVHWQAMGLADVDVELVASLVSSGTVSGGRLRGSEAAAADLSPTSLAALQQLFAGEVGLSRDVCLCRMK